MSIDVKKYVHNISHYFHSELDFTIQLNFHKKKPLTI